MQKEENAILLGIGTTKKKFFITNSNPGDMHVWVPAVRYVTKSADKQWQNRDRANHECLFNKGDTLEVLCPETVTEDEYATLIIHKACNGENILAQQRLGDYVHQLEFKEECVLKFKVAQVGHFTYGCYDECVCIQPVTGSNLWIDRWLTLEPEDTRFRKLEEGDAVAPNLYMRQELYHNNNFYDIW